MCLGVREQPGNLARLVPGGYRAVVAPDVTGRLLYPSQERFDPRPEGSHVHTAYLAEFAAGSDGRLARRERVAKGALSGYLYRRMCTFCTKPINAKNVTRPDPPYEMNGSGKPVMGMRPIVIATFWNTCHSSIVKTPAQR